MIFEGSAPPTDFQNSPNNHYDTGCSRLLYQNRKKDTNAPPYLYQYISVLLNRETRLH